MKTMKHILWVICVTFATTAMAADFMCAAASAPTTVFQSTSTMSLSGSSLPSAAMRMTIGNGISNAESNTPRGPQRVSPERPPEDPFDEPVGDAVLPLLLLVAGYGFFIARKRRAIKNY